MALLQIALQGCGFFWMGTTPHLRERKLLSEEVAYVFTASRRVGNVAAVPVAGRELLLYLLPVINRCCPVKMHSH